jgi:hypothetical protein
VRTVVEWARKVWQSTGEPCNVIEDGLVNEKMFTEATGDIVTQLDAITAEPSPYRWELVGNRRVLCPRDSTWSSRITNVHLKQTPRFQAATNYLEILRAQVPGLGNVVGPILKGDPAAPIFTDKVSLSEEASVVEHLVQLLGTAPQLVFLIERTADGRRLLQFENVEPPSGQT